MVQWIPVIGYEELYEVSDEGQVRRIKAGRGAVAGRIVQPIKWGAKETEAKTRYMRVRLYDGSGGYRRIMVHRLVAEVFIRPGNPGELINHIDDDPTNNRPNNLEWTTHTGNMIAAVKTGQIKSALTPEQVRAIRALRHMMSSQQVGEIFGASATMVRWIWIGRRYGWVE